MISIDEMQALLDGIAAEFPPDLFRELNGGIILLPEEKPSPSARGLYVLGEYHHSRNLGRFIAVYYGSFLRVYGGLSPGKLRERLIGTLKHEFTHHLESLAGERDLEIEDAREIEAYLRGLRRK